MNEATIQIIKSVERVPDSDNLDVVKVLGWNVVVRRNEFKVGDFCVYVQIDSILPERPEFEFMRAKHFRVKTARLRGCLSQGICFPISITDKYFAKHVNVEGEDVSDALGIVHYEKPIPIQMQGMIRCGLPYGIPKTDEERIENCEKIIDEIQGEDVYVTTKLDGTSATYAMKDGDFHVCSRNNSYKDDVQNIYWRIAKKYNLMEKLSGMNIAIQGEIVGPNIQGNKLGLKEPDFFVFNIINLDNMTHYNFIIIREICKKLELNMVPLEYIGPFQFNIEQLKIFAHGKYEGTNNLKEGSVVRTTVERYSRVLRGRTSFKVVDSEYLLKNNE